MEAERSRALPLRVAVAAAAACALLAGGPLSAQTAAAPFATGQVDVGVDALLWWFKSSPTPTPIITDGLYGEPGTQVLLGGGEVDTNPNAGFRLHAAYAASPRWGIEGSFFYIPERSTGAGLSSTGKVGSKDLLLPFFDVLNGREEVTEISYAGVYGGSAAVELSNRMMGAEANVVWPVASARPRDAGLLAGLRWLRLEETYTIHTSSPGVPPQPLDVWDTTDRFEATNDFYGVQVGARARYDEERWFASGRLQVGLGGMVQKVSIGGSLVTNDFTDYGPTQVYPGGYFALPTNIGASSRTVFAVVPEVRLDVGYRLTPSTTITAGYSFLYASSVVRPGNQVSRNINPSQSVSYVGEPPAVLSGPAQPTFEFNDQDFWTQGISIGLNMRF